MKNIIACALCVLCLTVPASCNAAAKAEALAAVKQLFKAKDVLAIKNLPEEQKMVVAGMLSDEAKTNGLEYMEKNYPGFYNVEYVEVLRSTITPNVVHGSSNTESPIDNEIRVPYAPNNQGTGNDGYNNYNSYNNYGGYGWPGTGNNTNKQGKRMIYDQRTGQYREETLTDQIERGVFMADRIVRLGERVIKIAQNETVYNDKTKYFSAVPEGITDPMAMWGWSQPWTVDMGELVLRNLYYIPVVRLKYQMTFRYHGRYQRGRYLTAVAIVPQDVYVFPLYKLVAQTEVPPSGVVNYGTHKDPKARMTVLLSVAVSGLNKMFFSEEYTFWSEGRWTYRSVE